MLLLFFYEQGGNDVTDGRAKLKNYVNNGSMPGLRIDVLKSNINSTVQNKISPYDTKDML
jgi:hypothetical protein